MPNPEHVGNPDLLWFNSRPHVAGDNIQIFFVGWGDVSIHARTWRRSLPPATTAFRKVRLVGTAFHRRPVGRGVPPSRQVGSRVPRDRVCRRHSAPCAQTIPPLPSPRCMRRAGTWMSLVFFVVPSVRTFRCNLTCLIQSGQKIQNLAGCVLRETYAYELFVGQVTPGK